MVVKEVRRQEEAARRSKAIAQAKQGRWMRWEGVEKRKLIWSELWGMESNRLSFVVQATYDVLPSPTNQQLWLGKDPSLPLCTTPATLKHILVGCRTSLTQGRYTWRHNQVLRIKLFLGLTVPVRTEQSRGARKKRTCILTELKYGVVLMEDLCLYVLVSIPLVVFLLWLWRDSLQVPAVAEKHVLITGCDSGFGNLLCKRLDRRGFHVLAACLTEKGADDLRRATGPKLKTLLLDVTDSASIQKAVEWTEKEVGDEGLWGLVNNAGRSLPMGPTEWMKVSDFESTLRVNMTGVIEITLAFLPLLKKGRGRVVNVASVLGRVAANGGGYCISKFAVESFSDILRRDIHYFGVKVSIIEPGFFKTAVTNLESLERELHRLWNQLTPDVRDSYGEKYLQNYIKVQRFILNLVCDSDLSKVTGCMEHALTALYPRTRYSAGWDAKIGWIPLSYAPAWVVDYALKLVLPRPAQSVS
ncbi:hypothetical protein GJAV_G00170420 [Gymnothorax javanicus]|nr:hypothetical protein GJAV_G00170420 [Gymnothorax javanicus]